MSDTTEDIHTILLDQYKRLDAQITSLPTAPTSSRPALIDQILAGISSLSEQIKDATPYLPAYDQRANSNRIKDLTTKLATIRASFGPKTKFSFKNRGAAKQGPIIGGQLKYSSITTSVSTPAAAPDAPKQENLLITDKSYASVALPATVTTTSSLLLSDLSHTILSPSIPSQEKPIFSSCAIKNIESSLLNISTTLDGPAHITGIRSSVLILKCHQFRMHDAHNVDVYLWCGSKPIIEDCSGVRFAPLVLEGEEEGKNLWDQVEDFKWLRMKQSPHWSVMSEEDRRRNWKEVVERKAEGKEDVERALVKFLPREVKNE